MLGVQIMADRRRAALVERLVGRLGLDHGHVTWDRRGDVWDTRRRATLAAAERGDWALVLQDDILVCRDLIPAAEAALAHVPERSIAHLAILRQRSSGLDEAVRRAVLRADEEGASWVRVRALLWGVAVAVPSATVPALLAWADRWSAGNGDDTRISQFYTRWRWPVLYPRPSLVDHGDAPSLLQLDAPFNSAGRIACRFVGEDASGLGLDWGAGVVDA
jgi:hypothetical protein